ncbi:hypothetical protein T4A_4160, partial [Trichinella pseudospiralis]
LIVNYQSGNFETLRVQNCSPPSMRDRVVPIHTTPTSILVVPVFSHSIHTVHRNRTRSVFVNSLEIQSCHWPGEGFLRGFDFNCSAQSIASWKYRCYSSYRPAFSLRVIFFNEHDVSFLWLLSLRHPLRATDKGRNILISPSFPEMEYNLLPFPPFSV